MASISQFLSACLRSPAKATPLVGRAIAESSRAIILRPSSNCLMVTSEIDQDSEAKSYFDIQSGQPSLFDQHSSTMDQSRALNALAPFVALAKSATSPRAAADLVTQATSAPNTSFFAELLQHPNIHALSSNEEYASAYELLRIFAWGTWDQYKASSNLPQLSDAQSHKLRLLSLLTIASQKQTALTSGANLSYTSLCKNLGLSSPAELESLITEAIYNDLLVGTLNPATQTVVVASVAPLRDVAPGSIQDMMAELVAWSGRCDSVLADLELEIAKVKSEARKRYASEIKAEKQVKAVTDASEKSASAGGGMQSSRAGGYMARGGYKGGFDDNDEDAMELDGGGAGWAGGGGRRRGPSGGPVNNFMGRLGGRGSGR
nr:cop9 signalosome complex subunit 7a [Quercus suber]